MTKISLEDLTDFGISKKADMAFVTLLNGEKKIEVIYDDYFVFRIYNRAKDNGLLITLVAIDDDTSLTDDYVHICRIDINPSRIAFAMTYLFTIYFKDRWFEARNKERKD